MRKYKLLSLESGVILGEVLEKILIMGKYEYVVQHGSRRMFVKNNDKVKIIIDLMS